MNEWTRSSGTVKETCARFHSHTIRQADSKFSTSELGAHLDHDLKLT